MFLLGLFALLIVAMASDFFLFRKAVEYYREFQAIRLDPLGLHKKPFPSFPEGNAALALGDSRIARWPLPQSPFRFVNLGIGGQTSVQVYLRYRHLRDRIPSLPVVLLQAGINDLKTIPLFPQRKKEIVAQCKKNLYDLITSLSQDHRKVIVATIFPTGTPSLLLRRPFWSNDVENAVREVNAYLRTLRNDRIVIWDAYALLNEDKERYYKDLLHLNETGYDMLNRELIFVLQNIRHKETK